MSKKEETKLVQVPSPNKIPERDIDKRPILEASHLGIDFGGLTAVDDFNMAIGRTEIAGLIGPNGAGKTTVFNLLTKVYQPSRGTILLDGQDIRSIPPEQLRKKFGVVFQNDFVTEGTAADNIRFFREISDDAVSRAADFAQAEFLWERPEGLETPVQVRGNNLSGGQKQRLLIARALAALEAADSIDPAAIAAAMPSVTYTGITGSIAFDENGDAMKDMAYIKKADGDAGAFVFEKTQSVAELDK